MVLTDPVLGEFIAVVTGEGFLIDQEEEFWTFHREEFVGAFLQAPEFIRAQVFKMVDDDSPEVRKQVPTGPYMFVYHWDCPEVPWSEVVAAAQTQGYVRNIESGTKWQGLNYHAVAFTEKQPERRDRYAELGYASEDEGEEIYGDAESEEEDVDVDEKSRQGAGYHEVQEAAKARREDQDFDLKGQEVKEVPGTEDKHTASLGKKRGDSVIAATATDSTSLNDSIRGLSIEADKRNGGNIASDKEADSSHVFASVSVADKIRAWEKNAA
jgi:hypothetical protein